MKVQGRQLISFLKQTYKLNSLSKIKFIKIDTEGHEVTILKSLIQTTKNSDFNAIFWIEWHVKYKYGDKTKCTNESKILFDTISELGYDPYKPPINKRPLTLLKKL